MTATLTPLLTLNEQPPACITCNLVCTRVDRATLLEHRWLENSCGSVSTGASQRNTAEPALVGCADLLHIVSLALKPPACALVLCPDLIGQVVCSSSKPWAASSHERLQHAQSSLYHPTPTCPHLQVLQVLQLAVSARSLPTQRCSMTMPGQHAHRRTLAHLREVVRHGQLRIAGVLHAAVAARAEVVAPRPQHAPVRGTGLGVSGVTGVVRPVSEAGTACT